jgi:pyruvate,orthophosphate dikinase
MPGMMDTVLNLGLNDETVRRPRRHQRRRRFAWDSYALHPDVCRCRARLDHGAFEEALEIAKEDRASTRHRSRRRRPSSAWSHATRNLVEELAAGPPAGRARTALGRDRRVFGSWQSSAPRSIAGLNSIPAIGARRQRPGDGVRQHGRDQRHRRRLYPRSATGERAYYGEYLINAQGEDVVAGIRTPQYLTLAARAAGRGQGGLDGRVDAEVYSELARVFDLLETHYRDMQDIEFTVERGRLFMLQTRSGKRTAKAALKIAVDMAGEGLISQEDAVLRIDPSGLDQLLHPTLDPSAPRQVIAKGLPASPARPAALPCSMPIPPSAMPALAKR